MMQRSATLYRRALSGPGYGACQARRGDGRSGRSAAAVRRPRRAAPWLASRTRYRRASAHRGKKVRSTTTTQTSRLPIRVINTSPILISRIYVPHLRWGDIHQTKTADARRAGRLMLFWWLDVGNVVCYAVSSAAPRISSARNPE